MSELLYPSVIRDRKTKEGIYIDGKIEWKQVISYLWWPGFMSNDSVMEWFAAFTGKINQNKIRSGAYKFKKHTLLCHTVIYFDKKIWERGPGYPIIIFMEKVEDGTWNQFRNPQTNRIQTYRNTPFVPMEMFDSLALNRWRIDDEI